MKEESIPSAMAKEESIPSAMAKEESIPAAIVKMESIPSAKVAKSDTSEVAKAIADGYVNIETSKQNIANNGTGKQASTKVETCKQESYSGGRQRKVLLVEDTRINRIILRKVLLNLNLECDEAENGLIAVDLHRQGRRYDLVLMDKEMPVMDGHEATRQLRSMGVRTPIVALTGNALTTDRELFFEAGVDDFQTKPLSRDKLVQLLARYGVENLCSKRT